MTVDVRLSRSMFANGCIQLLGNYTNPKRQRGTLAVTATVRKARLITGGRVDLNKTTDIQRRPRPRVS